MSIADKRFSMPDPLVANFMRAVENGVARSLSRIIGQPEDPRRDINDECGLPDTSELTATKLKEYYDRDPISARVVQMPVAESWNVQPTVFENEDTDTVTAFEEAWDAVGNGLRGQSWYQDEEANPVWEYLQRVDELSGIGYYGILLLGLDDGLPLNQPVPGVEERNSMAVNARPTKGSNGKPSKNGNGRHAPYSMTVNAEKTKGRKLLYLRAFDETQAQITQYEANRTSPRYGQPVMYSVTLSDPTETHSGTGIASATVDVHWTRVIHVADNLNSSEIFGVPRMRPVYNNLHGLRKIYCGSPEAFWKGVAPILAFETHPQLGGDVTFPSDMKDQIEQLMNGLQRSIAMAGISTKTVAPTAADPTAQVKVQIEAICIKGGYPIRIFMGSERGQLASSQDERAWMQRMQGRRMNYLTPRLIVPFVDRLILVGVLPEPEGYSVLWPAVGELTLVEQMTVATQRVSAISAYLAGGVESLITPMDFLVRLLAFDEEEAASILESTSERVEEEDTGGSPLLSMVGGITGMGEMFKAFKEGAIGRETLKQQIMTFFKLSEEQAEAIIADTEPPAEPEPQPPAPIKVEEGEKLVNPDGTEPGQPPKTKPNPFASNARKSRARKGKK